MEKGNLSIVESYGTKGVHANWWFWILVLFAVGIVVIGFVSWYYTNRCTAKSQCSKLCENAKYPCVYGCRNGRCESHAVSCDMNTQIWCPALGKCIARNELCPTSPIPSIAPAPSQPTSSISNVAAAVDLSGRSAFANQDVRSCLLGQLNQAVKMNMLNPSQYSQHIAWLEEAYRRSSTEGISIRRAIESRLERCELRNKDQVDLHGKILSQCIPFDPKENEKYRKVMDDISSTTSHWKDIGCGQRSPRAGPVRLTREMPMEIPT